MDEAGRLVARRTLAGEAAMPERPEAMAYASGGQGLWSARDDYLACARMFLGGVPWWRAAPAGGMGPMPH